MFRAYDSASFDDLGDCRLSRVACTTTEQKSHTTVSRNASFWEMFESKPNWPSALVSGILVLTTTVPIAVCTTANPHHSLLMIEPRVHAPEPGKPLTGACANWNMMTLDHSKRKHANNHSNGVIDHEPSSLIVAVVGEQITLPPHSGYSIVLVVEAIIISNSVCRDVYDE